MPQERGIETGKKVSIKRGGEHRDKARRRATVETMHFYQTNVSERGGKVFFGRRGDIQSYLMLCSI